MRCYCRWSLHGNWIHVDTHWKLLTAATRAALAARFANATAFFTLSSTRCTPDPFAAALLASYDHQKGTSRHILFDNNVAIDFAKFRRSFKVRYSRSSHKLLETNHLHKCIFHCRVLFYQLMFFYSKHHNPSNMIGWLVIWTEGFKYPLIPQMYTYNPHDDTH